MRTLVNAAAMITVMVLGLASQAAAQPPAPSVPEINPASISAGLAVLAGGALLLRARRNLK